MHRVLQDLKLERKLLAITSDSASNNRTLVKHLHHQLLKTYNDKVDTIFKSNLQPLMQFQGLQNHIRCIAHALNRIAKDILSALKTGTLQEA